MTKILIDRATAEQALDALKEFGYHGSSPRWERTANALKAALEQQPVQEPTPWRDMVVVSLVREGINKHKARELADHFAAQQQVEPDAYGYASRFAVAMWEQHYKDVAPQWKPLDNLMGVLTQIDNMTSGLTRLEQPKQEPVAWGACVSGRVFVGRLPEHARKISEDEGAPIQWLYTTPPAVERPWVGLTEQDMPSGEDPMFDHRYFTAGMVYAAKVLQEKNT